VRYSDCPPFDAAFKEAHWSSQADGANGQMLQIVWQQQALLELRAAIATGCMRFVTSEQVLGCCLIAFHGGAAHLCPAPPVTRLTPCV
jgi:hypothetical protein